MITIEMISRLAEKISHDESFGAAVRVLLEVSEAAEAPEEKEVPAPQMTLLHLPLNQLIYAGNSFKENGDFRKISFLKAIRNSIFVSYDGVKYSKVGFNFTKEVCELVCSYLGAPSTIPSYLKPITSEELIGRIKAMAYEFGYSGIREAAILPNVSVE